MTSRTYDNEVNHYISFYFIWKYYNYGASGYSKLVPSSPGPFPGKSPVQSPFNPLVNPRSIPGSIITCMSYSHDDDD